jgi:hypothetical protein
LAKNNDDGRRLYRQCVEHIRNLASALFEVDFGEQEPTFGIADSLRGSGWQDW